MSSHEHSESAWTTRNALRRALLGSVAALCVVPPTAALAQDGAQPAAGERGIEEVVVTARKRLERVQDVPASITALSSEQIERYDLTSLEKVAQSSPQFQVGRASNGSGAQLTLRGIGSSSTSIGIEQSVAVIVDGAYYGQGRVINEGFFDLERVELLKGPQSLFFGKNATAGVVSLATAEPTSAFEMMARVGYEFTAEQVMAEGVVSGPVTDKLALRLAVRGSKMFGGYFDNKAQTTAYSTFDVATAAVSNFSAPPSAKDAPGGDEVLARLTLKFTPSDRFTNTLKISGDRNTNENSSWNYGIFDCVTGASSLNPATPCTRKFDIYQNKIPAAIAATVPYAEDGDLTNKYYSFSANNTANFELDKITLTSVTNLQWNRNRWVCACDFQSSNTPTWATENATWLAYSEELRALTTFDGPVNALFGVYYQRTHRIFDQFIAFAGLENSAADPANRFLAVSKNGHTRGQTISPFFQFIVKPTPQVEVTAGARYTTEEKDSDFRQPYVNPALTGLFVPGTPVGADQTFSNWSPEATIRWKPTEDVTLYAAYKTGFKSGGFSISGLFSAIGGSVDDFAFAPEKVRGFEGGIKTSLLDRQLRLNVTAYNYLYENLQVDFFTSTIFAFVTLNAGSAKTTGVEVEVEYAPRAVEGLTLRGSANYNDARYGNFIGPCWSGQTPAQGCTTTVPGGAGTPGQDLTGFPLAMAPDWTASFGFNYEMPVGQSMIFGISMDGRYSGEYLASSFGNPFSEQPDYVALDASLRLKSDDDRWEFALIGKNLSNEYYITGVVDGPSTGAGTGTPAGVHADQIGFVALPRTIQAQLTWRY